MTRHRRSLFVEPNPNRIKVFATQFRNPERISIIQPSVVPFAELRWVIAQQIQQL
jgi:hypothetical protein